MFFIHSGKDEQPVGITSSPNHSISDALPIIIQNKQTILNNTNNSNENNNDNDMNLSYHTDDAEQHDNEVEIIELKESETTSTNTQSENHQQSNTSKASDIQSLTISTIRQQFSNVNFDQYIIDSEESGDEYQGFEDEEEEEEEDEKKKEDEQKEETKTPTVSTVASTSTSRASLSSSTPKSHFPHFTDSTGKLPSDIHPLRSAVLSSSLSRSLHHPPSTLAYHKGDKFDYYCRSDKSWYTVEVVACLSEGVKMHYCGWHPKTDFILKTSETKKLKQPYSETEEFPLNPNGYLNNSVSQTRYCLIEVVETALC